ncbi:hypothetical protein [Rhodopirellula baltica]|uniref:Uncharacterized protein n=1 Tax=Rhodopirellula baltica SWK14 TaxID=993516 RepID=L7C9X1_RHOBT|nr:hypothetical protein [Rhodopirellula baltica]ELP30442.1 hypothetical protein RBSWK_05704 [Rhodopirellula baltica SWK14]
MEEFATLGKFELVVDCIAGRAEVSGVIAEPKDSVRDDRASAGDWRDRFVAKLAVAGGNAL